MRRRALRAAALLAALPVAGAGCQTVTPTAVEALGRSGAPATGGSEFAYAGGRAVQVFPQPMLSVHPAVLAALDDLRFHAIRQITDGGSIIVEGQTADDRKATVTLRPHPAGTRLSARVGLFGDQPLSRAVMDRVGIRLGALPPGAIPETPPSSPAANPYFSRTAVSDAEMLRDLADAPYRATAVPDNKPY